MPFKSKAQRRKFAHLLVEGKINDEQYERWNKTTGRKDLPEHVRDKNKKKTTRTRTGVRAKKRAARRTSNRATVRRRTGSSSQR